jgi:hypothetical protein
LNDAPNTLEQGLSVNEGSTSEASDPTYRYGDYFGSAVDPSSRSFVWLAGEFGSQICTSSCSYNWATYVLRTRMAISPYVFPSENVVVSGVPTNLTVSVRNPTANPFDITSLTFGAPSGWTFSGTPSCGNSLKLFFHSSLVVQCFAGSPQGLAPGASDLLSLGNIIGPTSQGAISQVFTVSVTDSSGDPVYFAYDQSILVYSISGTTISVSISPLATNYVPGTSPYVVTARLGSGQQFVPVTFSLSSPVGASLSSYFVYTNSSGSASVVFSPSTIIGSKNVVTSKVWTTSISGSSPKITTIPPLKITLSTRSLTIAPLGSAKSTATIEGIPQTVTFSHGALPSQRFP